MLGKLSAFLLCGVWGLTAAQTPDFAREIQPVLKASCLACHSGPKAMGALRLDSREAAMRVIVPGNSADSRLLHRILGLNGEPRMPVGGQLPDEQIAKLRAWIDAGAVWLEELSTSSERHWAYVKPVRPALPDVKNTAWVRNPIDRFVLARLEQEQLAPSPEASREVLLRRAHLDLTGLPPSATEIDEFLADSRPDAFERVVDKLLASPHYGERWARPWLDLARYADTNGYEKDRRRSIWKFRDWVIDAFNRDLPFDQFTIEQIAGDMLPGRATDQLIASGFHRNTMFNEEGGVDKEEAHWENLVDRTNTTATVWLGSTIGCAQCHNHKYDPFSHKEYYQLLAFFNNSAMGVQEYGDTSTKFVEPVLDLPTPEQARRKEELRAEIAALEKLLKTPTPELEREQAAWERSVRAAPARWRLLDPDRLTSSGGSTLAKQPDGAVLAGGTNPANNIYAVEARLPADGIAAIRIEALPHASLPRGGPGRDAYGNFFLTQFHAEFEGKPIEFGKPAVDDGRIDEKKFSQLWTVDASREDRRLPRQIVFPAKQPFGRAGDTIRLYLTHTSEFAGQGIGHFRLSVSQSDAPETIVSVSAKLRPVFETEESRRTPEEKKQLADYFRGIAPQLEDSRKRLARLRRELDGLGIVTTLVMGERKDIEHPGAVVRARGQFLSPGETVQAGVPSILPPLPPGEKPNRLGLARWLVSPENPLTARVAANRIWEQYFGRGLVETTEDFGTQGAAPTHPGLLDWLATEFIGRKWSMKAMHRLIVTSATYRQSSRVNPALQDRDPYNKLLARGPRFRMEAEMIRDVTLAAGGLLSRKIGGPSVFPYQPDGIWDIPYNDDKWTISEGEDRYRRGLYTFIRRTAPYPSMMTFDGTSREFCTVRRVRTNTPLQSLTTLNDPAFFEAAQAMAKRILAEGGTATRSRIEYGFRLATARKPKPAELDRMVKWHESERAAHGGEDKAWTMLANVLLNLDEALTKE